MDQVFTDSHSKFRAIANAFSAGMGKACKKSTDGKANYAIPEGESFATHILSWCGIESWRTAAPDFSGHKTAAASVEAATKVLLPHLVAQDSGRRHAGSDARQLANVKIQFSGQRKIACIGFNHLHQHLTQNCELVAASEKGSYAGARKFIQDITPAIADDMLSHGMRLQWAVIGANTALYMPPGWMMVEAGKGSISFGMRVSFCLKSIGNGEEQHIAAVAKVLESGPLKDSMTAHMASALTGSGYPCRDSSDGSGPSDLTGQPGGSEASC